MPSCYTPELSDGSHEIRITDVEFHHLGHVKRIAVGSTIKLNNGRGLLATAEVVRISKHSIDAQVVSRWHGDKSKSAFALAFALLKNRHDELIVEKVTELGATGFYPLISEFSVRTPGAGTISRFEKIAISAIKQCDNPWLPFIKEAETLPRVLQKIQEDGWQPVLCSERRPDIWMKDLELSKPPCFLIGPEGGWSAAELTLFSSLNIKEISISSLILRAETAAIAIAAQYAGLHC